MSAIIRYRSVLYYPHRNFAAIPGPECGDRKRKIPLLENPMPKRLFSRVTFLSFVAFALTGATRQVQAQAPSAPYPAAAPFNQYLTEKATEIELARSAAPASISDGAEVLVLTPDGYTTAVKGGNGFVCLVERSWAKDTGDSEFWNPKVRAPLCLNAPSARTYLPIVLVKTKLVLAAKSKTEIAQALKAAMDTKELPPLEPNAMCYMMSRQPYLSDNDMHWHPHMMWYVPGDSAESWKANLPGVPVIAANVPEDRMTVFMLVVDHWSDGTPFSH